MFAELSELAVHLLEGIFSFVLIKQNIKSSFDLDGIIFSWRLFISLGYTNAHQQMIRPTHRNDMI